jgi:hypothetical protein
MNDENNNNNNINNNNNPPHHSHDVSSIPKGTLTMRNELPRRPVVPDSTHVQPITLLNAMMTSTQQYPTGFYESLWLRRTNPSLSSSRPTLYPPNNWIDNNRSSNNLNYRRDLNTILDDALDLMNQLERSSGCCSSGIPNYYRSNNQDNSNDVDKTE